MIFQILIVDDEPHVVDAIRGILEQEPAVDMEIHTAFRGQQALKMCQQYPIQLLITDIRMPDMSGLELAKVVKENNPDCKLSRERICEILVDEPAPLFFICHDSCMKAIARERARRMKIMQERYGR